MKIRMLTGGFHRGTHYSGGKEYEVSQVVYEALKGNCEVLEPEYTYQQNGTWYTVFLNGEQVDKFQGKDGLAKYGLADED